MIVMEKLENGSLKEIKISGEIEEGFKEVPFSRINYWDLKLLNSNNLDINSFLKKYEEWFDGGMISEEPQPSEALLNFKKNI